LCAQADDLRLLQDNVAQHRAIREAVDGRHDGAEARRLMVAHITRSGELIATRLRAADERRRPSLHAQRQAAGADGS
jgi:DNA-binding GntR family transcriptional regulator